MSTTECKDQEKTHEVDASLTIPERYNEHGEYILDAAGYSEQNLRLKTAADGHTVLIPQPSEDPDDPLNWPQQKKNTILFVITCVSFISDFSSAIAVSALVVQSKEWQLPPKVVQHNLVGNIFCLGSGGLIATAFASYFGRLPVLFYYQVAALCFAAGAGAAGTFKSYLACRILEGLFATVGISSGTMWIKDLYFLHEHPRKINFWSLGIIASPYVGPLVGFFVLWARPWPWAFWVVTIINGICLTLTVLFAEETFYNRDIPIPRPYKMERWARILGIEQWRSRKTTKGTFLQCMSRPVIAFSKIPLASIVVYYLLNFAWIIGVNTTVSLWLTEQYDFNEWNIGLFYIAAIVGVGLGWLVGHWLHDLIGEMYMRRHKGHIDPEARLYVAYPSTAIMAVSVLILGFALRIHWHYMVLAVLFAAQIFGIVVATVSIDAYLLDAYPEGSGEVGAWTNFGRATAGFMATYVEIEWVVSEGSEIAFGIQAAISLASALIIVFLHIYGKRLRIWQGPMKFATN